MSFRLLKYRQRRAAFQALVEAQDRPGATVEEAREAVCTSHRISELQLRYIEAEGLQCDWPLPDPAPVVGDTLQPASTPRR